MAILWSYEYVEKFLPVQVGSLGKSMNHSKCYLIFYVSVIFKVAINQQKLQQNGTSYKSFDSLESALAVS